MGTQCTKTRAHHRAIWTPHHMASAIIALAVVILGFIGGAMASATGDFDRWYTLELQGRPAGWVHTTQQTHDKVITTRSTQHVRLRRDQDVLELTTDSTCVESEAGTPISMRLTQSLGATPITLECVFAATSVDVTTTLGLGREPKRESLPLVSRREVPWLTPAAATKYIEQRLGAGATDITLRTPEIDRSPLPVLMTLRVRGEVPMHVGGKPLKCFEVAVTKARSTHAAPVESTMLVDERGVVVRSDTTLGGLGLRLQLSDHETAQAPFEPPDASGAMIVRPDKPIESARDTTSARYLLRPRAGSLPPGVFPTTGAQTTERANDGTIRVVVETGNPAAAPEEDINDPRYAEPSMLIDSSDLDVMKLSRRAVNGVGQRPNIEQAEAMRRFVHGFMTTRTLSVGVASATEVARSKAGDCTEHAVLLAGMLRAGGIPSRVVVGLVYADLFGSHTGVFVYHMWAQALIESTDERGGHRWIDLDATLSEASASDATHIALLHTSLDDAGSLSPIDDAFGHIVGLQIEVIQAH